MQKHNSKYNFNILGGNANEKQGITTDHVRSNSLCGRLSFNFVTCSFHVGLKIS